MSANFIEMISEVYSKRFAMTIKNMIESQEPFGIFWGFQIPGAKDIEDMVATLRNGGLNIVCVVLIEKTQEIADLNSDIHISVLEDLKKDNINGLKPHTIWIPDVVKDMAFIPYFRRFGVNVLCPLGFDVPLQERRFSFMMNHLPDLYSVYGAFKDETSRKSYLAVIKGRLTGNPDEYIFSTEPQYFLEGFCPEKGDIVIDGGAFDGGTSAAFAERGTDVYAFEMNEKNYRTCLQRAKQDNFTIENLGLSNKEIAGYYSFNSRHLAGSRKLSKPSDARDAMMGHFIDLDTYVKKKNLAKVDFIKLDIEGSELDMLHGAAGTITRYKPKMAISAYHKPEDLWTLQQYIKGLHPDYEFCFRHYGVDFTDYDMDDVEREILSFFGLSYIAPNNGEYVLYCR